MSTGWKTELSIVLWSFFYLFLQNEVEVASAANNTLKDACEAAEKAKEDLMEKLKVSEVFIGFALLLWLPFSHSRTFSIKYE